MSLLILRSFHIIFFQILLIVTGFFDSQSNHGLSQWLPQQTIPGYQADTWPPLLLTDQNHTVHAFSSQWFGEGGSNDRRVIVYNRWTLDQGWNEPIDILLPSLKNDARLTSAMLDQEGIVHLVFLSGDNTLANLYYSRAPIIEAGNAAAWSEPIMVAKNVQTPENAVIFGNDSRYLGMLFAGAEKGTGIYATYSTDGGAKWSNPVPIFLTIRNDMLVHNLQLYQSRSGQVHAVWNEVTSGGQGRGIYYTTSKIGDPNWRAPIKIGEAESGYGTNTPAVIEKDGEIFAFYNLTGITMRRSKDGGVSWSKPATIFSRHLGVNGSLSLAIDSNNELHLFFGQRITGNPDIHGMWHSVWQGNNWSEPEAIVSGPAVPDQVGEDAFDPFEARGVVSQGNVLLVTWRSDPGLKGNGVWYSYKTLDAPELPVVISPAIQQKPTPDLALATSIPAPTPQVEIPTQVYVPLSEDLKTGVEEGGSPMEPMLAGLVPAILLIALVIALKRKFHQ